MSGREFYTTDFYGMYEPIDLARAALLAADNIRKRMRDSPNLHVVYEYLVEGAFGLSVHTLPFG